MFGLREGKWKYIELLKHPQRELYDLELDPGETQNLAPQRAADTDRFSRAIVAWRARHERGRIARDEGSAETREALKALGYVQ
jgi:hypothetical protein